MAKTLYERPFTRAKKSTDNGIPPHNSLSIIGLNDASVQFHHTTSHWCSCGFGTSWENVILSIAVCFCVGMKRQKNVCGQIKVSHCVTFVLCDV